MSGEFYLTLWLLVSTRCLKTIDFKHDFSLAGFVTRIHPICGHFVALFSLISMLT